MIEFELHVFELSYLLSLMRVESVAALPDAVLFPKDAKVRKKVHADGEKRLVENGLIFPDGRGNASYDDTLMSMCAAVADPRLVIITRRETIGGERADATIYFNNVEIVEVTQVDRHAFRLRRLVNATTAFHSVRKMLAFPPESDERHPLAEVRVEVFEQVRRHLASKEPEAASQLLIEAGVQETVATRFSIALGTPRRKGIVSILQVVAQKVVDVRVLGCYFDDETAWVTSVVTEPHNRVCIEAAGANGFLGRLADRVASFDGQITAVAN